MMRNATALITGGNGHIGRAIATNLSVRGCNIRLIDKNADGMDAFCEELSASNGVSAIGKSADLGDPN
ncbi:MAG: SDR family NAD(P)-dependent oxidoreductase, partial [Alphaproteobacteria bacterium]|nr:SDR family NAD(P)-dependent oxidoreductase [Alphaproteobacteria bacterium]